MADYALVTDAGTIAAYDNWKDVHDSWRSRLDELLFQSRVLSLWQDHAEIFCMFECGCSFKTCGCITGCKDSVRVDHPIYVSSHLAPRRPFVMSCDWHATEKSEIRWVTEFLSKQFYVQARMFPRVWTLVEPGIYHVQWSLPE